MAVCNPHEINKELKIISQIFYIKTDYKSHR